MIKDTFERRLAEQLRLTRVSAPLFLLKNTGLNDNLNGVEQPVHFQSIELHDEDIEIIHSLAKWKRDALHRYGFKPHTGFYTRTTNATFRVNISPRNCKPYLV